MLGGVYGHRALPARSPVRGRAQRRERHKSPPLGAGAEVTEVTAVARSREAEARYPRRKVRQRVRPDARVRVRLDEPPRRGAGASGAAGVGDAGAGAVGGARRAREGFGRLFVARQDGALTSGFVLEGESRAATKNRIRFFVALDSSLAVKGVRVLEHEEDPGLGAEIATPVFPRSSPAARRTRSRRWRHARPDAGRLARRSPRTRVLHGRPRRPTGARAARARSARPIYAVTGATISSRALARRQGHRGSLPPPLGASRAAARRRRELDERDHRAPPGVPGQLLFNGIVSENPVFRLALSLCPAVAVTTTVANGFILGVAVLAVQVLLEPDVAIARGVIHPRVRIPVYTIIIAVWVSAIDMTLAAFVPALYAQVGSASSSSWRSRDHHHLAPSGVRFAASRSCRRSGTRSAWASGS